MELLAYQFFPDLTRGGDALILEVFWHALRPIADDLQIVINWEDAQRNVWHSWTGTPTGTDYRTSLWRQGESWRGLLVVPIPPAAPQGMQKLHLLMYSPDRGAFLSIRRGLVPWAGRNLPLGEVVIE